jgi:RNA polymerase sigma-70 factor (ECF subfamily)
MEDFEFTGVNPSHFKGFLDDASSHAAIAPQAVSVQDPATFPADHEVPATELVRRFNGGDESAFLEMMRRYQDKIFNLSLRILKNRADAEEITQDTFIRAHRGLAKFRGDSSLITWLHRIAMNLARNRYWYYFRRKRQATLSLDYTFGENADSKFSDLFASEAPDPGREAVTSEFVSLVGQCMKKLDPVHLKPLTMRYALNSSYEEIAEALGLNVGTVKSRLSRAREHLREHLAQACPEFASNAAPSSWLESAVSGGSIALA